MLNQTSLASSLGPLGSMVSGPPLKQKAAVTAGLLVALFMPNLASAFTTPATTSLAYDVYNVVVNQGVEGAIGFTAGVMALVFGGFRAISGNLIQGVMALVAGVILINAEAIIVSLGMTV